VKEESIFARVAEDLLKDFSLEEIIEEMNMEPEEVLEAMLERYLYDPTMPAFIRARVVEFEEKEYNQEVNY